ncbi:MAG: carboxymuconolactone decarboxylase family protein [bacterium]|nr:carboxymuconolactone decarboxylase family protein [bacterium]
MTDPPKPYEDFIRRFPKLGEAWNLLRVGALDAGPLDERTLALTKVAVATGAQREGALHAAVRKALGLGVAPEEIEQVIALAASTVGLPATVAAWTWAHDEFEKARG